MKQKIVELIRKSVPGYKGEINLDHPSNPQFGDYSTNVAMVIAKTEGKNPNEVANGIKEKIELGDTLDKAEVVGGFINFYLKKEYLKQKAEVMNYEQELRNDLSKNGAGKTVVIDYSAPNIAKPFGIGHLRSTNIGQALYNIYKILGWNTIGDNHLGDWGTQFGKLIVAIKNKDWNNKNSSELTIDDLEKLYVRFHKEAESDPSLVEQGREWFAKLEEGDVEAKTIWQTCIDISQREFDRVYQMLDVKIDYAYGESFYEDKMKEVLEIMEQKKILKESQGAKIVEFDDMPPAMAVKSNETSTYFIRDLATILFRIKTWKPELMIYEVGNDHILHFKQVFETARALGWKSDYIHVPHGMIRWATGKFSTRKGDTIHLEELIERARVEAKKIAPNNSTEEINRVAIGAIKFNDLSLDPKKDIIFDWQKLMSMEGNSGPYLQYTYARCQSVLGKTKILEQKNIEEIPESINDEEMALLREFYKFEEKVVEAAERYNPAVIAEFLLTIARKYNEFYAKHRVIGEREETWRVFLTKTTASTIKTGLGLLGIKTLEKM